ncbi:MAG TPA: alpha-amylase family glycosyl hydrolase, partial [Polyangiaceae bacterium]
MSVRVLSAAPPLGAHLLASGAEFSLWSDKAREASLVLYGPDARVRELPLASHGNGVFSTIVSPYQPGTSYDFRIDGSVVPDPYARFLPDGVHGPAEIWPALPPRIHGKRVVDLAEPQVIYELHVGTFTQEGTFASAMLHLPELAQLGVTVIELLPISAFSGRRGWGYDGVALFAPLAAYGTPADLARLIDAAHGLGLSMILDVVYNHLGPDGNYLGAYSDNYFDSSRQTPWGDAPALDRLPFRRLVLDSARYWLSDLGFDGLRLDAVHALEPGGDPHIVREIALLAHSLPEPAVVIAEDERNDPEWLFELGVDAVWSDDFHHVLHVLLTGEQQGYYSAY